MSVLPSWLLHALMGVPPPTPVSSQRVLVSPGIPTIPRNLVQKIRRWEYVELVDLLPAASSADQASALMAPAAKFSLFPGLEVVHKRKRQIANITDWTQAFLVFRRADDGTPIGHAGAVGIRSHNNKGQPTVRRALLEILRHPLQDKCRCLRQQIVVTPRHGPLHSVLYGQGKARAGLSQLRQHSPRHPGLPGTGGPQAGPGLPTQKDALGPPTPVPAPNSMRRAPARLLRCASTGTTAGNAAGTIQLGLAPRGRHRPIVLLQPERFVYGEAQQRTYIPASKAYLPISPPPPSSSSSLVMAQAAVRTTPSLCDVIVLLLLAQAMHCGCGRGGGG